MKTKKWLAFVLAGAIAVSPYSVMAAEEESSDELLDRVIHEISDIVSSEDHSADQEEDMSDDSSEGLLHFVLGKLDSAYHTAKSKGVDVTGSISTFFAGLVDDDTDIWESVEQVIGLFVNQNPEGADVKIEAAPETEEVTEAIPETEVRKETEAVPETEAQTEAVPETEAQTGAVPVTEAQTEAVLETKPQTVEYEVKAGDCLWAIAKDKLGAGNRYSEIAKENDIDPPYEIMPGQTLIIPAE